MRAHEGPRFGGAFHLSPGWGRIGTIVRTRGRGEKIFPRCGQPAEDGRNLRGKIFSPHPRFEAIFSAATGSARNDRKPPSLTWRGSTREFLRASSGRPRPAV